MFFAVTYRAGKTRSSTIPSGAASPDPRFNCLLEPNNPEVPIGVARASRIVELVRLAIVQCSTTKLNAPQSIDEDGLAQGVFHRAHEGSGGAIEAIDRPPRCIVRNQQGVAQRPKVRRSHSETPWLVQWSSMSKTLHEGTILLEDIDVTPAASRSTGIRDIEFPVDVLYPKRCKAGWKCAICK